MTGWHLDDDTLRRYVERADSLAEGASAEQHLLSCEPCRARVNAAASVIELSVIDLAAVWDRTRDAIEVPRPSGFERLLRAAGLPARYVSGYLHADPSAEPGQTAVGESHAWVEYWAGSWRPLDPTSGADVRERHVVVARGRDYADIPPLKGIYHGAPAGALHVTVEVTRLA